MDDDLTSRPMKKATAAPTGEVEMKSKSGTAWSHNFLNQKPWHPLSYQNQRRKWIAEQTDATRQRRAEEVKKEFEQEQQFFRQTALFNKKDKDKVEMMKAVSFMYVRPPGYNPESAKAAEIADQNKSTINAPSSSSKEPDQEHQENQEPDQEIKKKARPKDVFGRALPTESEFEVLKNAPKMDTGIAGRSKPFGIEIRNVRCVRCNTFGHQSGDRECALKDKIMPNDETRLKRDDPLNVIKDLSEVEPLKWELKVKPGLSPPRGGFRKEDPNQQILAEQEEEIFDEYGGFLSGGGIPIPELISNFSPEKTKKKKSSSHSSSKRKQKRHKKNDKSSDYESEEVFKKDVKSKSKHKRHSSSFSSSDSDNEEDKRRTRLKEERKKQKKHRSSSEDEILNRNDKRKKKREHVEYENNRKNEREDNSQKKYKDYYADDSYDYEQNKREHVEYGHNRKERKDRREDKSSRNKYKDYGDDSYDERNKHRNHYHERRR